MIVKIHDLAITQLDAFITPSMDKYAKSENGSTEGTVDLTIRLMSILIDPNVIYIIFLDGSSLKVNVNPTFYSSIEVI